MYALFRSRSDTDRSDSTLSGQTGSGSIIFLDRIRIWIQEKKLNPDPGSITLYPCEFSISFLTMTWIETGTESSGSTENWKSDQDPNSGKKTGSYRILIRTPACMLWMPLYAIVTRAPNANQPTNHQPSNKQTINHPTNRPHRPIRVPEHIRIICIIHTLHKYL